MEQANGPVSAQGTRWSAGCASRHYADAHQARRSPLSPLTIGCSYTKFPICAPQRPASSFACPTQSSVCSGYLGRPFLERWKMGVNEEQEEISLVGRVLIEPVSSGSLAEQEARLPTQHGPA